MFSNLINNYRQKQHKLVVNFMQELIDLSKAKIKKGKKLNFLIANN